MTPSRHAKAGLAPVLALFLLLLSACTVGLVPAYDAGLAEGLADANRQTLLLFAQDEVDPSAASFSARADDYARVISTFEELKARAEARPVPPLSSRLAKTSFFRRVCPGPGDAEACLNASPGSLTVVVTTLRTLRDRHRQGRLEADQIELFKNQYLTALHQALKVESALKR